jgi:cell division inhibitor SepF
MPEQQGLLKRIKNFFSFDADEEMAEMEELTVQEPQRETRGNSKVVPITKRARMAEISIYTPSSFDDALVVADSLKEGKAVVLNLSRVDISLATRVLDFVSGIIHAINGDHKKVGDNIFVFTPSDFSIGEAESRRTREEDSDNLFFAER